jgi:hypothetical protein
LVLSENCAKSVNAFTVSAFTTLKIQFGVVVPTPKNPADVIIAASTLLPVSK